MARDYQAENQTPEARARRRRYNESPKGQAANRKGQKSYRKKYPHRVKAQQKVRHTHGSSDGHKCAVCGKPATAKHHPDHAKNPGTIQWLCHAHHVAKHHDTNMTTEKGGKNVLDGATYINLRPKMVVKASKDKIPGGLADGKKPADFPSEALAQGVKVELEHTTDRAIAQEIAMDHLTEDPKYYAKLKRVEKSVATELAKAADELERELLKSAVKCEHDDDGEEKPPKDEKLQKPHSNKPVEKGSVSKAEEIATVQALPDKLSPKQRADLPKLKVPPRPNAAPSPVRAPTQAGWSKPAKPTVMPSQSGGSSVATVTRVSTTKSKSEKSQMDKAIDALEFELAKGDDCEEDSKLKPGEEKLEKPCGGKPKIAEKAKGDGVAPLTSTSTSGTTATSRPAPAAAPAPAAPASSGGVERHTPRFTTTQMVSAPKPNVRAAIGLNTSSSKHGTRTHPTAPAPKLKVGQSAPSSGTPAKPQRLRPGQMFNPDTKRVHQAGPSQPSPAKPRAVPKPPIPASDRAKLRGVAEIFSAVSEASKPGGGRDLSGGKTTAAGRGATKRFVHRVGQTARPAGYKRGDSILSSKKPRPMMARKAEKPEDRSSAQMGKGETIPMVGGVGGGMMKTKDGEEANVSNMEKSYNSLQEGEITSGDLGNSKNDPVNTGGGSGGQEFSSDPKSGMPAAESGSAQVWSDDDRDVGGQMSEHKKPLEAHCGKKGAGGGSDLAQTVNAHYGLSKAASASAEALRTAEAAQVAYQRRRYDQSGGPDLVKGLGVAPRAETEEVEKSEARTWHQGQVLYTDGEDQFIEKAQNKRGEIVPEPTLGIPHSPLTSMKGCTLCKSAMPQYLTTCPSCGVAEGVGPHVGTGHVVLEKAVAESIRPNRQSDLYLPFGTQNTDSE